MAQSNGIKTLIPTRIFAKFDLHQIQLFEKNDARKSGHCPAEFSTFSANRPEKTTLKHFPGVFCLRQPQELVRPHTACADYLA
jgi:hypothetical protein